MTRTYYTLLIRVLDDAIQPRWFIEFGDYDREVVEQERDDHCESYDRKKKDTKIITTNDDQREITRKVNELNEHEHLSN